MKRRRLEIQLSEGQQLILALLLVILVAISMLYCLGLASVALQQNWEKTHPIGNQVMPVEDGGGAVPTQSSLEPTGSPSPVP